MKKVLVTGCSGYIGSHLCKMLEKDYDVYGLDIKDPQTKLKHFNRQDINRPISSYVTLDAVASEIVFDAVIHLAALVKVGDTEKNPIQCYITNINGTMNVVNKIKTKNFIFASTGLAELCNSTYGISKRAAEDVVREFCTAHNPTPYTIFRFYNVIGTSGFKPTNPDGLMHKLMQSAETGEFTIFGNDYETPDGTCVRDYVHVEDLVTAHIEAIKVIPRRETLAMNVGTGTGASVLEVLSACSVAAGRQVPFRIGARRDGDPPRLVANPEKIFRLTSWRPTRSSLESITQSAWRWFDQEK